MMTVGRRWTWIRRKVTARTWTPHGRDGTTLGLTTGVAALVLVLAMAPAVVAQEDVSARDVARVQEVERLLERYGDATWSGWGPQPILMRTADRELLFAHPAPPDGFVPIEIEGAEGLNAHASGGHVTPGPIASAWPMGDAWAVAIPTLDIFQETIDAFLGEGAVSLDDATYVRALVHETFHAFQLNALGGPEHLWPDDRVVDEREVFGALQSVDDLDAWHARQGEALVAAMGADDVAQLTREAQRFLALRRAWRAVAPAGTRELERQIEWVEGLARYADVNVMMSIETAAVGESATIGGASAFAYPTPDMVWSEFLAQVTDPASIPGSIRDRYYVLGAAQAFVLDRLMPEWHERAFPGREALEDLLAEAVGR